MSLADLLTNGTTDGFAVSGCGSFGWQLDLFGAAIELLNFGHWSYSPAQFVLSTAINSSAFLNNCRKPFGDVPANTLYTID